ncbi:MFS transporter [Fischerella thermalis]|jgi:predicted MFS family arabinose efflux permease|uniref:Major facilitator superfamily MFS_1 n=1 Tax=Fischerella thermalis JSC-11 TaxID=741277 RepID=G6FPD3_9CYAN|nr:MFS transporter [Fischerella thermalis]EHC18733.1 major facilitator superfamily MFS_1 [Fischerella thermalis JSC-11]PLZ09256.1 MFS transporter [Fischerella thermalis WC119]PLZ10743.1 MFS transporter [Fischerella thermalis WC114]PLZ18586.1 MFS transporter [Fischerella thermalis WC1110]PLZ20021.1 MFS transporter [Fischerella thermalis WC157]
MFPTEPAAVNKGFGVLLRNRGFMLLWIGQLLSQLADKIFFVLMIALLENYPPPAGLTENSMYSALMVVFTVPAILFGSAGGVFVDRFPKKLIMVGSDVVRGLLTLLIPFLPRQFLILLILTFAISSVTQFFAPAEQAVIPLLVRRENLMAANALFSSTMMGALIVGFAIGEPSLSWAKHSLGPEYGQELVVAVLYLSSAGMMQPINFKDNRTIGDQEVAIHPWADFKQGLRYLKRNRLVLNAMLQLVTLYCVFAALVVLAIQLAAEFGLKEKQFGFFLAAAGVGMVIGAAILGHWGDKFHHKPLPLIGFLMMAVVLGTFTFVHKLSLALVLCAVLGIGAALIGVPMQTLIQQQTPPSMLGKVFGFQNHAINIALSAPLAITGPITDALGLRTVLVAMSVIVAVIGVWAWQNTRKVLQDVI